MSQQSLPTPGNSWTILLYIAADGVIANFGIESLKQVSRSVALPAQAGEEATVVAAAQFSLDAPDGRRIPRYVFNQSSYLPLSASERSHSDVPEKTEQAALDSFLTWALEQPECKTENYALVLWGHGPEFLLQPPVSDPNDDRADLYLTPEQLRLVLQEHFGGDDKPRLSVIGYDACSMSMLEMAYEIRGCADFMLASQEEVPDLSFPYDRLVEILRQQGSPANLESVLKCGIHAYINSYRDYVCSPSTGMASATLSALNLKQCDPLVEAVGNLSGALEAASKNHALPQLLIAARQVSRDFSGGLFVDLADFAANLQGEVVVARSRLKQDACASKPGAANGNAAESADTLFDNIDTACGKIIDALVEEAQGGGKALVVAKGGKDRECNGVSIYLPYLTPEKAKLVEQPMVKGGIGSAGGKEFTGVVNQASSALLMCVRREMIRVTEGYYASLKLAKDTCWYHFIQEQWSRILAENALDRLDTVYSAQQCSINLAKPPSVCVAKAPTAGPSSEEYSASRSNESVSKPISSEAETVKR